MKSKKKKVSIDDLKSKKAGFRAFAQSVHTGEVTVRFGEPTLHEQLAVFKEEIALLKGLPYTTLRELLAEHTDLRVLEQTLRKFCQQELGWPSKAKKNPSAANEEEEVDGMLV